MGKHNVGGLETNPALTRLKEHVSFLSNECPHRHTGEPDERKAAEYIAEQMQLSGLKVNIEETPVMGWRVESSPFLQILEPEMLEIDEVVPFIFSGSTPAEGIEGELEYCGQTKVAGVVNWEKFAIRNQGGNIVGFIVGRPDGPCITQVGPPFGLDEGTITWTTCIVGKGDYIQFKKWIEAGATIRVKYMCETSFWPNTRTYMVKGTLAGSKQPECHLLVSAHHDVQGAAGFPAFADPRGANDNASGCAGVLEIARYCYSVGTPQTIEFVTFSGEERNLILSRDYARRMEEQGTLRSLIAHINLDSIAKGDIINLFVTSRDCERHPKIGLDEIVRNVVLEKEIMKKYKVSLITPPGPGFDHWPFFLKGSPVLTWNTFPFPEYHRGNDRYPEAIQDKLFATGVECLEEIIHRITCLPVALS